MKNRTQKIKKELDLSRIIYEKIWHLDNKSSRIYFKRIRERRKASNVLSKTSGAIHAALPLLLVI